MSAILVGCQRHTVKDMALAGYQVPKGVSTFWPLQRQKISIPVWISQTRKQFDHKPKILHCWKW